MSLTVAPHRRVVLVVGGASGIGHAVARRFAADPRTGAVLVTSRDPGRLDAAVADIRAVVAAKRNCGDGAPVLVTGLPCALGSEADCVALAQAAKAAAGRVDAVVHAAGATLNKLAAFTAAEDFLEMHRVNCVLPCLVAKAVLRHGNIIPKPPSVRPPPEGGVVSGFDDLAATAGFDGGASFVAIGSVVGEAGNAGQVAYAASKAALSGAYKALAKEYGGKGVRFNVVAPGLVDTAMARGPGVDAAKWAAATALRRVGQPAEVAAAVALAVECGYLNGQVITVDGGRAQ